MKLKKGHKNRIEEVAAEIVRLSKLQDEEYNKLLSELNPTKYGDDVLFDYIFNCFDDFENFEEYLCEHGMINLQIYKDEN